MTFGEVVYTICFALGVGVLVVGLLGVLKDITKAHFK